MAESRPDVGLFVTCLVDLFRPSVGLAAVALLERAGCRVHVPDVQTCCGQPGYNGGDRKSARAIAVQVIDAFASFDYVVAPSGSCAGMITKHYPELFEDDPALADRARDLARRTFELVSFLVDVRGGVTLDASFDGIVTYHDSCSGLRELGIRSQPRELLGQIGGLRLEELSDADLCCGFGGAFCVKYPDISNKMVSNKVANIDRTGADAVLAGDLGCLLNIAGKLKRNGSDTQVRHIAEVLAGMTEQAAIGEGPE